MLKCLLLFLSATVKVAGSWLRRNIETLAYDENIMLVTGQAPPEGHYYSFGEKIEGNVMEIEFRTE